MADNPFQIAADHADPGAPAPAVHEAAPPARVSGLNLRDLLSGNWLLAALVAAGALSLWAMSLLKGPAPASAKQIEVQSSVDDALAKLSGPLASAGDKPTAAIVATFYCEAKQRQIPPEALRGNPFVRKSLAPSPEAPTAPEAKAASAPADTAEPDAMAAARGLRLQSVLLGARQNAALICDNLLTEGQVIHGWTVAKILPREVHLAWKDKNYVLKMPE